MGVYVVGRIEINEPEQFREYQRLAGPSIQKCGGRVLAAGPAADVLEGIAVNHNVILEFDSEEQARAWYDGPDYQVAITVRRDISDTGSLIVLPTLPAR
jgi:uncharacterized protein (DUF1330 family)